MPRGMAAFRQLCHPLGELEHLIEIGFEAVPGQGYRFSFCWRNRFRLMLQMAEAAASKRRRIAIC